MLDQLSKEYDFYKSHKPDLLEKYSEQYIALKNQRVIVSGKNKEKLVKIMLSKGYKLGEFLVHFVSSDSDIVQRYYSRVF
jgi:hypothetical protein